MWGRTLYTLLDNNNSNNDVALWDINTSRLEELCDKGVPLNERNNKFFFGRQVDHEVSVFFPEYDIRTIFEIDGIRMSEPELKDKSLREALKGRNLVFLTVPSVAMRETLEGIKDYLNKDSIVISCSKGLEYGTNKTHSQMMEEILPQYVQRAVLSGPNLAMEILDNQPTATVVASPNKKTIKEVIGAFQSKNFKLTGSYDMLGVELAGAFKNIIAISSGLCDGLGYGMNSKASLITRGLAEISQLYLIYGARIETLYAGLAGVGDLIATCMSDKSRNHKFGVKMAQGKTMEEAINEIGMVVEGVHTLKVANDIIRDDKKMAYPIIKGLYGVVYEKKNPHSALDEILKTPGILETLYLGKIILHESFKFLDPKEVINLVEKGYQGEKLKELIYKSSLRNYYESLIKPVDKNN